jgi:hypothetical protein
VAGRDLQRARAEVDVHVLVADDRHAPGRVRERHDALAPDQVLKPLVVRVDRDRGVAEDGLRPRRRDFQE